jgi:chromosome partitioning protein
MIIIIGNKKGGTGKSTLTLLLANFLTQIKECRVTVIDMDYQQSIAQKYDKARILENAELYQVLPATPESYPFLCDVLSRAKKEIVLIDLGKLDDDSLIPVFNTADLVICPFSYDEFSFYSTILFSVVLRNINPEIAVVFVPNRVKANAKFEVVGEVNQQLCRFGKITPVLPDRVDFQRTSTFQTPPSILAVISPVFEQIYADHIHGKNEIAGLVD